MVSIVASVKDIAKADKHYAREWMYYDGEGLPEIFSNPRVARLLSGVGKHYEINICRTATRVVQNKLDIQGLRIVDSEGNIDTAAEEQFTARVARPAKLAQQLEDGLAMAGQYGDAYLISDPQSPDSPSDPLPFFARSPIGCRAFYDRENPSRLDAVVSTWLVPPPWRPDETDEKQWLRRVNVMELAGIMRWISTVPHDMVEDDDDFEPYDPEPADESYDTADDGLPIIGTYGARPGFVPNDTYDPDTGEGRWYVHHLRPDRPYGRSEHRLVHGAQNLIVKAIVTLAESLDGFALPYRFAIKNSESGMKSAGGVFEGDEDDEPEPQGQSGEMGIHYDTTQVGQLTPADVTNLLEPISMAMRLAASVSGTPLDYFDASAASASGESKKEHREALNARVMQRRRDYGREVEDAVEFMLEQLGFPDHGVKISWKPLDQKDPIDQFEALSAGLVAGVPWNYLLSTVLDLDPNEIDAADWPDPRDLPAAQVDVLLKLAQALQHLGSASTLGVVSSDTVAMLVQRALAGTTKL
jgi:hypothetical protein